MNTLLFEKDQVARTIDLADLKLTLTSESINGRAKKNAPISHYNFIEILEEKFDKRV